MKVETLNDDINKIKPDEKMEMPYVRSGGPTMYCIFRVSEKKIKNLAGVKTFITHMERLKETLNADEVKRADNRIIHGSEDVYNDIKYHLRDVKLQKNSVIGREILLTATPEFFKTLSSQDFERWLDINREWAKSIFGDNLMYLVLHRDESSEHLHGIIVPKFWSDKRGAYTLQSYKYFDGPKMLQGLQDSYADAMQRVFPALSRGVRSSKSKHISMKKLYGIMNSVEKDDLETLQGKAANQEYLKEKLKGMATTVKSMEHSKEEAKNLKEENKLLRDRIIELEKSMQYFSSLKAELEKEQGQKQELNNNATAKRGFSGKRYGKTV